MTYDLVITGARVVDPARGIDRVTSVAVADGKIAAVGDAAEGAGAKRVIRADGKFLSPGWFDIHVHTYNPLAFSNPDTIGVLQGVPTVVDAGGGGVWTYEDCRRYWEGYCKTEIYAFLIWNPAGIYLGRTGYAVDNDPANEREIPAAEGKDVVDRNRDRICAIKSQVVTRFGWSPVRAVQAVAGAVDLPIYLHLGDIGIGRRTTVITREVLDSLRPGDGITHAYTGNWGKLLDDNGVVYPEVKAAQQRGVFLDVGYGNLNFTFDVFDRLMAQDVVTDVISSDLQAVNITGPTHSLANVMSIFLNNGLGLSEVIERVTIRPARVLGLAHRIGSLTPGHPARITLFDLQDGEWTFRDSRGARRKGRTMIVPTLCVMDGEVIESDFGAGLGEENWSFMPSLDERPPASGNLDEEQREFVRALAVSLEDADWNDCRALHARFRRHVADSGINERKAANAIYDLFLRSRFCVPIGWLLNGFDRELTLTRMKGP